MSQAAPVLAVHYAEIALKGKNRRFFQRRLRNNLAIALKGEHVTSINHVESRMLVRLADASHAEAVVEKAKRVFGVQWLSLATPVPRDEIGDDLGALRSTAVEMALRDVGDAANFKVETRRSDNTFPLISPEISALVGGDVQQAIGLPVRLAHPEFTVHLLVLKNEVLIFTQRITAYGGLPVGSSGRVMVLMSGGIDSPVAAWLMMKRGCRAEFIHFYSGRTVKEADTAKIEEIVNVLGRFSPSRLTLHLTPAFPYESRAIGTVDDPYDMLLFRRYMFKTAEKLARRQNCLALVAGDSLGQVASQTLPNLAAIGPDIAMPVMRPLVGLDKLEITAISRKMGAFEPSIQPYRDCCSIRSPHPVLNARACDLLELSEKMDMDAAVDEAIATTVKVRIEAGGDCAPTSSKD